jgi:hypothetical protein
MREGEKAKIKSKKKYAFGRPGEIDKLVFPHGYDSGEGREKITSKGVIYEVELVKFVPRTDINHNGSVFKQQLSPPVIKHDHDVPCDLDDVRFTITGTQDRGDIFEPFQGEPSFNLDWEGSLKDVKIPLVYQMVENMKRGEEAEFTVIAESLNNSAEEDSIRDEEIVKKIKDHDPKKNIYFNVKLHSLVKVEDWYKDGSTLMRTLR